MKKTIAAIISVLLALPLMGCASTEAKDSSSASSAASQQKASQQGSEGSQPKQSAKKTYEAEWTDGAPDSFGGADSTATPINISIAQRKSGEYCLIMEINYQNNSDTGKNLINDSNCKIDAYQDGIELDSPGVTSESGVYDYNDAFTKIKGGATVSAQLVWVLRNTESPIELNFGRASHYKSQFTKNIALSKVE